jgi:hypothetical protein
MKTMTRVASLAVMMVVVGPIAGSRPGPAVRAVPQDPRADLFVRRGCTECHAITAFHVKATKDVGPDLTYAYGEVVTRYGVTLESFLYDPSGVMRVMLAEHLHLSRTDREAMIRTLRELYNEHRAEIADESGTSGVGGSAP